MKLLFVDGCISQREKTSFDDWVDAYCVDAQPV